MGEKGVGELDKVWARIALAESGLLIANPQPHSFTGSRSAAPGPDVGYTKLHVSRDPGASGSRGRRGLGAQAFLRPIAARMVLDLLRTPASGTRV